MTDRERDDQAEQDKAEQDKAEQDRAEQDRAKYESAEGVEFRRKLARNMPTYLSHKRWCEEHGTDNW